METYMGGMSSKINRLMEKIEQLEGTNVPPKQSFMDKITGKNKESKGFKLPKKYRNKKKLKQNYAVVIFLRTNGDADFQFSPIVDDTIYVKQTDTYYVATANYVFRWKNYPLVVIPEWNIEALTSNKPQPFDPEKDLERIAKGEGMLSMPQRVLLHKIAKIEADLKDKKGGINKWWLIIGIIIIVGLYLLSKVVTPSP